MKTKNLENFQKLVSNEQSGWLDTFLNYKANKKKNQAPPIVGKIFFSVLFLKYNTSVKHNIDAAVRNI